MPKHIMLPNKYSMIFYNLEGEISFEITQVSLLTVDQLKDQTSVILEEKGRVKDISRVEVIEL